MRVGGEYQAMLYVNDRRVNGPAAPQPLAAPKGNLTHWMGNKPSVGLTAEEAEAVLWEIDEWTRRTRKGS